MNQKLRCIHSAQKQIPASVEVSFYIQSNFLCVQFLVSTEVFKVNPKLPKINSAWGLWETDVVELFVRANDCETYYEFQVSPLGQFFELEVIEPRVKTNQNFKSEFQYSVVKSGRTLDVEMKIPINKIEWNGNKDSIVGGAFAVLSGSYYALFLPEQKIPDFHLPTYFRKLVN